MKKEENEIKRIRLQYFLTIHRIRRRRRTRSISLEILLFLQVEKEKIFLSYGFIKKKKIPLRVNCQLLKLKKFDQKLRALYVIIVILINKLSLIIKVCFSFYSHVLYNLVEFRMKLFQQR